MKKVIARGIDMLAKNKDEKTMKAVEADNKLLDKAVGFLETLVNKTPPAFGLCEVDPGFRTSGRDR